MFTWFSWFGGSCALEVGENIHDWTKVKLIFTGPTQPNCITDFVKVVVFFVFVFFLNMIFKKTQKAPQVITPFLSIPSPYSALLHIDNF